VFQYVTGLGIAIRKGLREEPADNDSHDLRLGGPRSHGGAVTEQSIQYSDDSFASVAIPLFWNASGFPFSREQAIESGSQSGGIRSNQFVCTDGDRLWTFRGIPESQAWDSHHRGFLSDTAGISNHRFRVLGQKVELEIWLWLYNPDVAGNVQAIGKREVDDAEFPAESHGRLGAPIGELVQAAAAASREDHRDRIAGRKRGKPDRSRDAGRVTSSADEFFDGSHGRSCCSAYAMTA